MDVFYQTRLDLIKLTVTFCARLFSADVGFVAEDIAESVAIAGLLLNIKRLFGLASQVLDLCISVVHESYNFEDQKAKDDQSD